MIKINYFLNHIKRIVIYKNIIDKFEMSDNDNTQLLVKLSDINTIIKNSVQDIVKSFIERHVLLEETHDTLINLPIVKKYYETKESTVNDNSVNNTITDTKDITILINDVFNKLSIQINDLKNEIDSLKIQETQHCRCVNNVEKENIKLEFEDIKGGLVDAAYDLKIAEEIINEDEQEEVEEVEEVEEEVEEVEEVEEEEADIVSVETESKDDTKDAENEDEEEELIEIEIDDITYCTNNEENGIIYELDKEGNVGKKVGYLKEGDAYFD
jgi:TolA-binding protein